MVTQRVVAPEYLLFLLTDFFAFLSFLSAQQPGQYSTSTTVLGSLGLGAIVIRAQGGLAGRLTQSYRAETY